MSAYSATRRPWPTKLGERSVAMTDHYLLMTATPHKGDPENFCLFLELLDATCTATSAAWKRPCGERARRSTCGASRKRWSPSRNPKPGTSRKLFTKRIVLRRPNSDFDGEELEFYDALTRYVEDQSIKASADDSPRGRAWLHHGDAAASLWLPASTPSAAAWSACGQARTRS
jgi:hypothetical protein